MNYIEEIIKESLQELFKIKCITEKGDTESHKLVFPQKRDRTRRISEQEARFLLVQQIEKQKQLTFQYAVEAPTMQTYSFTGKKKLSGNVDLCIYDKGKRISIIELKANNYRNNHLANDFEKLFFDYEYSTDNNNLCNFFIHILEKENPKIEEYYSKAIKDSYEKHNEESKSNVIIFVCVLDTQNIAKYIIESKVIKKII
jgi:ribosomal protein L32